MEGDELDGEAVTLTGDGEAVEVFAGDDGFNGSTKVHGYLRGVRIGLPWRRQRTAKRRAGGPLQET